MKSKFLSKNFIIRGIIIFIIAALAITFVKFNYFLYDDTIATIETVKTTEIDTQKGYEGRYEEKYYNQQLIGEIKNGNFKGQKVYMENKCTKSGVYDTTYHKGDDVFIEKMDNSKNGKITATVSSPKRDFYVATAIVSMLGFFILIGGSKSMLTVLSLALNLGCFYIVILLSPKRDFYVATAIVSMLGFFILIGGSKSMLTVLSLALNLGCFYIVILLYFKGFNILLLSIPMVIIFAAMLLLFMYGRNIKTLLAFAATVITTTITIIIAIISLKFSDNIDYDFLEYIIEPYDPLDAQNIFLAEILVGCLGAVMDVVVTMIVTIEEITLANPNIDKKSIIKSCRNVGDEIVGTMIAIMFFTNLASDIPFFILSMRNGIAIRTILSIIKSCRNVGDEIVGTMIAIMFFTNLASDIPFFILSMRNGIAIRTILRYNYFFEIGRFLTGSIAIVLAIPIASFIGIMYYKRRIKKC